MRRAAQRAKFAEEVHKPPLRVNVINFEKKLHVCTYSTVRFTLRFVNLFIEVSRVCGGGSRRLEDNVWYLSYQMSEKKKKQR